MLFWNGKRENPTNHTLRACCTHRVSIWGLWYPIMACVVCLRHLAFPISMYSQSLYIYMQYLDVKSSKLHLSFLFMFCSNSSHVATAISLFADLTWTKFDHLRVTRVRILRLRLLYIADQTRVSFSISSLIYLPPRCFLCHCVSFFVFSFIIIPNFYPTIANLELLLHYSFNS